MIWGPYDTETVHFVRYPTVTQGGQEYPDYDADPVVITAEGCAVEQGDSREDNERGAANLADFTVWAPLDLDIRAGDEARWEWAGRSWEDYQVEGRPILRPDPFGIEDHQLVSLTKREGVYGP